MTVADYDVVVIGSGVGGYTAAIRAGQLGLRTACVEGAAVLGGTCLNVGCIPSKALLYASEMFDLAQTKFAGLGVIVSPTLDLLTMMSQKKASVGSLGHGIEYLFRKHNVTRINGWGKLSAPGLINVRQKDGTETQIKTRHTVIATGSIPGALPNIKIDQKRIVDSTGALSLREPPRRLLVIGAGSIGLEIGSVWRRLGARVEVVEYLDRILPGADEAISSALQRILEKQGLAFRLGTKIVDLRVVGDAVSAVLQGRLDTTSSTVDADVVLIAIGRQPFVGDLGLETIGLKSDQRGFIPTQGFQTSVPGV